MNIFNKTSQCWPAVNSALLNGLPKTQSSQKLRFIKLIKNLLGITLNYCLFEIGNFCDGF